MSFLQYPFMVNALRAGTIVAILAGALGWFVVLRAQSFATHTQAVIGFPGAAAAVMLGLSPAVGYYTLCIASAGVMGMLPGSDRRREQSAAIGTLQAFVLAAGYLFTVLSGKNLNEAVDLLFGSFLGVTSSQVRTLLLVAIAVLIVLGVVVRPLLFASIEPEVARASGLQVRPLGFAFMLLVGVAVATVSQITGSLLVFALLVIPAATARVLSARPWKSIALSIALSVVITWSSLIAAYYSNLRTGVFIAGLSFLAYLVALTGKRFARFA